MSALKLAIGKVITPRVLFGLALAAVIATWLMLLIGGLVNPNEAGMACSAGLKNILAPACDGKPMEGHALFEHGHRLWGYAIGWLTIVIAIGAWASPDLPKKTKLLALGTTSFIFIQGMLGLLTVWLGFAAAAPGDVPRTNPYMSTVHLVVGYSFLAFIVFVAWRLAPSRRADPTWGPKLTRRYVMVAAVLTFVQVIVGGAMRHFGAGMICGDDPIGCSGRGIMPSTGLEALHMGHRLLGYLVAIAVVTVAITAMRAARRADRKTVAALAWVPLVLVLAQVTLGLLTVASGKIPVVVAFHTAIGGLLLASLVGVFLGLGPLGARRALPSTGSARATNAKGALA